MDELPDFFAENADDMVKKREAWKKYSTSVARSFAEVFGTPSGRIALRHLKNHLMGPVVLDRGAEPTNETIRRDAFRDVYFWIEGLAQQGERQEVELGQDQ